MRKSSTLVAATVIGMIFANTALAQPRPYNEAWRPGEHEQHRPGGYDQRDSRDGHVRQGAQGGQRYYYNGRWVDGDEWRRHNNERERWARDYQRRSPRRDNDSDALVAGIIGFALGAAIVGSLQDAERARTADASFDRNCARRFRSYDRSSRTYMGSDGLRHYCR
jgi:hypothetical protein